MVKLETLTASVDEVLLKCKLINCSIGLYEY